ncbi:MAG TPA: TonB-dependent receptor plug domain-containing protein [Gemmatimonadaceae bacterium]|nr:TonB-dependent receptor plug domain-containing protein [Gemmatimonadaceae bacterium]
MTGRIANLIGTARSASEGHVGTPELRARPLAREGELLETVPGVIVTQHSGEGKANQYFVRGFNLDHGTDFQTMVDGMPVNQPTHAHGQGYTDLNFLIPEFVRALDYKLGVYHAELGDFGSAGGAEFFLARKFDRPIVATEFGANGLGRIVAGRSTAAGGGDLLLGGEAKRYDGPWSRAEALRKYSGMARWTADRGASQLSVMALAYRNRWDSSDQIPLRAIRGARVDRFGQVDSTLGGNTSRYSLSATLRHVGSSSVQQYQAYAIRSALDLLSNFTYFLDDPIRGDQFQQVDRRTVIGGSASHLQPFSVAGVSHMLKLGLQTRADIADVGLHRTERRERFATVRQDDVRQWGTGVFMETESRWQPWFRSVLGARADGYLFDVRGDRSENAGRRGAAIVSPKASLIVTPNASSEFYLSGGFGFHSNDARGTTIRVDPVTGKPARRVDPLVRSRGGEVGTRLSPSTSLRTTLSAWALTLDSELLFVGDAGATEPTTESRRAGITLANFYRLSPAIALDADISFARARLSGVPAAESRIPGALERVVAAGVTWNTPRRGLHGAVRVRHFGAYPLEESNQTRAASATLVNADAGIALPFGARLQLTMLNVLNSRAADIQYRYTSRLRDEPAGGVADFHIHPVEPRQLRLSLNWVN